MDKIIKVSFFIFLSAYFLLENDVNFIGTLYFYILLFLIGGEVLFYRKISLLTVWNFAFLFIINSEIFSIDFNNNEYILSAVRYLLVANNLINVGYLTTNSTTQNKIRSSKSVIKDTKIILPFLILLVVYYSTMTFPVAITSYAVGRDTSMDSTEGSFLAGSILNALGFILPAVLAYYFTYIKKNKIWVPILFSSPIFIILFLGGTRFPLLFSLLGFIIVIQAKNLRNFKFKNYVQVFSAALLLLFVSDVMKSFRVKGATNIIEAVPETNKTVSATTFINSYFSPEGVIDMTSLMFRYFQIKPHLNGSSSSFLLYFWVPRFIWNDKPTMLGHWFIREYRGGFSAGHSASFGFTGDLYADFGLFSLVFVFLLGRLLRIADNFKNSALKAGGFEVILGAMFFPFIFFFVRSPITSSMNFLGILFFYVLLKKIIFKKIS